MIYINSCLSTVTKHYALSMSMSIVKEWIKATLSNSNSNLHKLSKNREGEISIEAWFSHIFPQLLERKWYGRSPTIFFQYPGEKSPFISHLKKQTSLIIRRNSLSSPSDCTRHSQPGGQCLGDWKLPPWGQPGGPGARPRDGGERPRARHKGQREDLEVSQFFLKHHITSLPFA